PSDSVAADTTPAARETAADRDDVADDGGGVRQRVFERAPIQRRVHQTLSDAAHATAPEGHGRCDGERRERDVDPAGLLSAALRLEGRAGIPGSPRAQRYRTRDGRLVRKDRSTGSRERLDSRNAIAEASHAPG